MKTTINFILYAIVLVFGISCREQEAVLGKIHINETAEEFYAKNPDLSRFSDREEFLKYDIYFKKFVYDNFSMEQKSNLWVDKLKYTLKNANLNQSQKDRINEVINEIKQNGLKNYTYLKDLISRGDFTEKEQNIYFENLNNFDKITLKPITPNIVFNRSIPEERMCITKWCTDCSEEEFCASGKCTETHTGCGLWWSEPCTKKCYNPWMDN